MKQIILLIIFFTLKANSTYSQNSIPFGLKAEFAAQRLKDQVDNYYRAQGDHQIQMSFRNKYYDGHISEAILCKENMISLQFKKTISYCKSYVMSKGVLSKIVTQYKNLSQQELRVWIAQTTIEMGGLFLTKDYESYSTVYLAPNGLATEEQRKTIISELPVNIQQTIASKLAALRIESENRRKEKLAQTESEEEEKEVEKPKVFLFVEQEPTFPGGKEELNKFITQNIVYPNFEADSITSGKVVVRFVVSEDGSVSDAKIKNSLGPAFDKEALRVVMMLPNFKAGRMQGKPVNVFYELPVIFR